MRLIYKKYADDKFEVYETDEDGRNKRVLETDVPANDKTVRRVPVFIEVNCDGALVEEARAGLDRLKKNLAQAK